MNHILIAYFSRRGENFVNGKVESLEIGNSEYIAKSIYERCASEIYEIKCVDAYPLDYHETTKVAVEEYKTKKRPELTKKVEHMEDYDTIILGYPNWCGTMPMGVCTFLESYDFTNKKILPFCTHEGSGMANSEQDIKRLCPTAQLVSGIAIKGSQVKDAHAQVEKWLDLNGVSCHKL